MAVPGKNRWTLSEDAFRRLLAFIDADPQQAAGAYQQIHSKLARFFEWKGCVPGVEFADETMDRLARRLEQGLESQPGNPYLYIHGIAQNIARERWRRGPFPQSIEEVAPKHVSVPSFQPQLTKARTADTDRRLVCLHECLDRLAPSHRELLVAYHLEGSGVHISRRRDLAARLNLPAAALRLRVYRIRQQLTRCVTRCADTRVETISEWPH